MIAALNASVCGRTAMCAYVPTTHSHVPQAVLRLYECCRDALQTSALKWHHYTLSSPCSSEKLLSPTKGPSQTAAFLFPCIFT